MSPLSFSPQLLLSSVATKALSLEVNLMTVPLALLEVHFTPAGAELTCSGAWKDASFKNYNFAAAGQLPEGGALHPLLKMREEMRQIFFDMGYVSPLHLSSRSSHSPISTISLCIYVEIGEEGDERAEL